MYMYNMCIELEDDIFNMIELFARDETLNVYLYQIGIVEVVCFQNVHESSANFRDENFASCLVTLVKSQSPQGLDMFQPLLESTRIRIEV